jgi:hypothetical protein
MSDLDGWHERHEDVYWFGPPESNTLCPVSRGGVLMPGLFVVEGTNKSGEGNGAQDLGKSGSCFVDVWCADA